MTRSKLTNFCILDQIGWCARSSIKIWEIEMYLYLKKCIRWWLGFFCFGTKWPFFGIWLVNERFKSTRRKLLLTKVTWCVSKSCYSQNQPYSTICDALLNHCQFRETAEEVASVIWWCYHCILRFYCLSRLHGSLVTILGY